MHPAASRLAGFLAVGLLVGATPACWTSRGPGPAPTPPPAERPAAVPAASPPAICANLTHDPEDASIGDAPRLCAQYHAELLPAVAATAVACMEAAAWDVCEVSPCTADALATAPPATDPRCGTVEQQCPGMGEHCAAAIPGMNEAGRARFTRCLVDNCGSGVRFCLWDAMVGPCR